MNALKELEDHKIEWENIEALNVRTEDVAILYTKGDDIEELKESLSKINYDSDFGKQNLFGIILMNDKTWYDREEHEECDGAEWWRYNRCPTKKDVLAFKINKPWI